MFQVNDIVLYNQTDVCQVKDIRRMPFLGKEKIDYYVLKPVYEDSAANSTVYVPVGADESRLHRTFSAQELRDMLDDPGVEVLWIDCAGQRKMHFAEILSRNHPAELIALIRMLTDRRRDRIERGQRISEADEKVLQSAQKRLYPLFRCTLNVGWNEFLEMVSGKEKLDLKALSK